MSETYYPPKEVPEVTPPERPRGEQRRSCNMHRDCDAAETRAKAEGKPPRFGLDSVRLVHCTDECCEVCFGS